MTELIVTEKHFEPGMTVGEAMALHPNARWVFASYHLGGCTHCAISTQETLAEVAEGYGLPLDKLMDALNSLLATPA
jgi:hybrid cluster-associated redox disulfide protein